MTTTLNDKNLENVIQKVKSSAILDQAKDLSVAPPRDENVMIWLQGARPCVPGPL